MAEMQPLLKSVEPGGVSKVPIPLTISGPIETPYGEDMSKPRQEGGRPAINQNAVDRANRARYKAYLDKISKATEAGIENITEQLTYEEIDDFGSLQAKFSK